MRIAALNSASRIKNVRAQANHTATPANKRHSRVSGFEGWYNGLPDRRPSRLRIGAPLPPSLTQGAHARHPSVFGCENLRELRRAAPPTRAPGTPAAGVRSNAG